MLNIKKFILILLIIISLTISFISQYNSLINTFKHTATLTEKRSSENIHASSNFIEDMKLYGNSFLNKGEAKTLNLLNF